MKLKIGGLSFNALVSELRRRARIEDGDQAGEVKSGEWLRDLVGTYYDYFMTIETNTLSTEDYDNLYEALTAPVESQQVTFPYGQETLSFDAYIENVQDEFLGIIASGNRWGHLSVSFKAKKPQRRPT